MVLGSITSTDKLPKHYIASPSTHVLIIIILFMLIEQSMNIDVFDLFSKQNKHVIVKVHYKT